MEHAASTPPPHTHYNSRSPIGSGVPGFQAGSFRLNGRGMLFVLVLLLLAAFAIVSLVKAAFGVALSLWQVLLFLLKGGAILICLALLILIGLGVTRWILEERKRQRARRQMLRACPLPRLSVIRGEDVPRSQVEQALASIVWHYLVDERGLQPAALGDLEIAQIRLELAPVLMRPVNAAILEREVIMPSFELLADGNPFLVMQIERYGQLKHRVPFRELGRTLHVLSRGHLGLSAEQTWQTRDITELQVDYAAYNEWFMTCGLALISHFEPLLEARLLKGHSDQPMGTSRALTSAPTDQDVALAAQLVEATRDLIEAPEPWLEPGKQLEEMADALAQARVLDPSLASIESLFDQVDTMKARRASFEAAYHRALQLDPDSWPSWLNEAYAASAESLSDANLKGHAARLYLTQGLDSVVAVDASTQSVNPSTQGCPSDPEEPVLLFPGTHAKDPCAPADSYSHSTSAHETADPDFLPVPPDPCLDPDAATQANTLF